MRFFGKVGFAKINETAPGVYKEMFIERPYYGDVNKRSSRWQSTEGLNDDLVITNDISIVADPYAYENFSLIKYVEYMGVRWKVNNVEVQRPRLILSCGGVFNEEQNRSSPGFNCNTW